MSWPEHVSTQGTLRPVDSAGMAADPVHEYAPEPRAVPPPPLDVPEGVTPPTRRGGMRRPLLDVLVELGYTTNERIEHVQRTARNTARTPEQVLIDEGMITADQLARAVAER